jgi:hypothetical protein
VGKVANSTREDSDNGAERRMGLSQPRRLNKGIDSDGKHAHLC